MKPVGGSVQIVAQISNVKVIHCIQAVALKERSVLSRLQSNMFSLTQSQHGVLVTDPLHGTKLLIPWSNISAIELE